MAVVGFLVADGFEESELCVPRDRVRAAGHEVVMLGVRANESVRGKHGVEVVRIDAAVADRRPEEFRALVIPGGASPARLCADAAVTAFVRTFVATGRATAAICHGPELLVAAGVVAGRFLTSWPGIRPWLEAQGACWTNAEVVVDGPLITSRRPADAEAFAAAIVRALP